MRISIFDAVIPGVLRPPPLLLVLETEREYPSLQYCLQAQTTIADSTVVVQLRGVVKEPHQLQGPGTSPAVYQVPLEIGPGRYRLRLRSDSSVDEYPFNLSNDFLQLLPCPATFTVLESVTNRVPPQLVLMTCDPAGFSAGACAELVHVVCR